jgi:hypothetical protein
MPEVRKAMTQHDPVRHPDAFEFGAFEFGRMPRSMGDGTVGLS